MASTRKSDELANLVAASLTRWVKPGQRLMLALSGGVDSVVLLDILAQLRPSLKFQLSALYVNHQISPNAPAWGRFCADLCARRAVPFTQETVTLDQRSGESLEALARAARYQAFARRDTDFMVLAQHLDDQAETLLLQLLRGAGLKGLSGMADCRVALIRPLLGASRAVIVEYAKEFGLSWIEDESNQDVAFDRNFLRHAVLPVLGKRFPAYRETLARTARHFAEAAGLLDDLALLDASGAIQENRLEVAALRQLTAARAKNLLRYFLDKQGLRMPSAVQLDNMLRQLTDARPDARIHIRQGEFELRRYRDVVYALCRRNQGLPELSLSWQGEEELVLPDGRLNFQWRQGEGLSLARLSSQPVTVRYRRGGERLRPVYGGPTRSLKNLLQESAVPPWQRERLPLVFCGDDLVFVPEVGIACAYRAKQGEEGVLAKFTLSI